MRSVKTTRQNSTSGYDPPPRPGGRYALCERLGRGGAGDVWTATDLLTGELVAVKFLQPHSGHAHARIRREVAALRLLRIPGVVRLLDEGIESGWVYLVMEFVRGRPFPGRPIPCAWSDLEPVVMPLLDTLGRIHAAGVVHRDLKPENVLVTPEGLPIVLDFGIARAPVGEDLTSHGEFLGTPIYTAPEAAQGEVCTPRSDFFSLGVMLFEALSGELPYPSGNRMQALFARVMNAARPLAQVAPQVPQHVADAVAALLERDANTRPATVAAAKAVLRGEQTHDSALDLPWIGTRAAVDTVTSALLAGRRIDVVGAAGSGRTHLLREVARRLADAGIVAHQLVPSGRPFGSLGALKPDPAGATGVSAGAMVDAVRARLVGALEAGEALLVDDHERVDAATRRLLDELPQGAVACALLPSASPRSRVELVAWTPTDLEEIFGGPERVLHLRSDAARALHARTAGVPARVVAELQLWIQGGWATRRGEAFEVSREALDQLTTAPRLRAPAAQHLLPADLSPSERDLLSGVAVSWPDGSAAVLARVLDRPTWEIDLDARALEERRLLRVTSDRFEPQVELWCDWSEGRRASAHRALAEVLPAGAERRLMHLIAGASGEDAAASIGDEALTRARRLAEDGALSAAVQVLDEGLRAVRRVAPRDVEVSRTVLRAWIEVALLQESAGGLDRVLYALCREPAPPDAASWETLVRAALAGLTDGARALALADALGPLADPDLERRRHAIRVTAARSAPVEREREVVVDAVSRYCVSEDARDRSSASGWLGRLRYREGHFGEAATLQEQAASLDPWAGLRVVALSRAASAHMEGFRFEEAERLARETRSLAARCRNTHYEALAEWVLRTVAYRTGRAREVDEALVEAAHHLGVRHTEALVCFTEAAVAWRAGAPERAQALATTAYANWTALGLRAQAMLARCVAVTSGAACTREERDTLIEQASRSGIAGVGVQALALLVATEAPLEVVATQARQVSPVHWSARIDVLSVSESLRRLGVTERDLAAGEAAEGVIVAAPRPSLSAPRA